MMLTCECEECGYTLFIAAGREGKFFGDSRGARVRRAEVEIHDRRGAERRSVGS